MFIHYRTQKEKYENYIVNCEFEIVFNGNQYCSSVTSKLFDNKKIVSWSNFKKKIGDFSDKGYDFNRIVEMNVENIANKLDMTYDF